MIRNHELLGIEYGLAEESDLDDMTRLPGSCSGGTILPQLRPAVALLTEDSASPAPSGIDRLSEKFDPIFDLLGQLDTDYRQGKPVLPGESLRLFLLGVGETSGGRGEAQHLVTACLENGVRRGYGTAMRHTAALRQGPSDRGRCVLPAEPQGWR